MSGFIEVTDIGSGIGAGDAPILINTDSIVCVVQGLRMPGVEGVRIVLKSGREVNVAEDYQHVKKSIFMATSGLSLVETIKRKETQL